MAVAFGIDVIIDNFGKSRKTMKKLCRICMLCMVFFQPFFATAQEDTLRFLPHWLPQAQFAGFYMACEKGIYENYDLIVDILKSGPKYPPAEMLASGEAEIISNFLTDGIIAFDEGIPLVCIGQISKRSAIMFISKKERRISHIGDFEGKTIGIWRSGFRELPLALLRQEGIDAKIVPITGTVNLFLMDGVDIMCVMWYNEYHQVLNSGIDAGDLDAFFLADHHLDYPEDGLYCLKEYYDQNPLQCRKFLQASLEGWAYAFDHKDEALEVVIEIMRASNVPANIAHQKWMLDRMEDLFMSDSLESNRGRLKPEDFHNVNALLHESGAIREKVPLEEFYYGPE